MTIKLAYVTERDGLVFLCDKNGKELWQVVPKEPSDEMTNAMREKHWQDAGVQLARSDYLAQHQAMLSVAKVDVSAALVKVPGRRGAVDGDHDFDECKGWDACLDELERS